jgi:hypothetical protein
MALFFTALKYNISISKYSDMSVLMIFKLRFLGSIENEFENNKRIFCFSDDQYLLNWNKLDVLEEGLFISQKMKA